MAGVPVGTNLPTFGIDPSTLTTRNGEYAGTPFTDVTGDGSFDDPYLGVNRGGGNNPGIGINTGNIDNEESWTLLDQAGAGRVPQNSQYIGGNGLGEGSETASDAIRAAELGVDFTQRLFYVAADQQAVPDAIFNIGLSAVNKTNETVEISDVLWGIGP